MPNQIQYPSPYHSSWWLCCVIYIVYTNWIVPKNIQGPWAQTGIDCQYLGNASNSTRTVETNGFSIILRILLFGFALIPPKISQSGGQTTQGQNCNKQLNPLCTGLGWLRDKQHDEIGCGYTNLKFMAPATWEKQYHMIHAVLDI